MQQLPRQISHCTTSEHGREVGREVYPWPNSDAARFHRGIACCVAASGIALPLATLLSDNSGPDVSVLTGTVLVVALLGLARHRSNASNHVVADRVARVRTRRFFRMGAPSLRAWAAVPIPLLDKMVRVDQRLVTLTSSAGGDHPR